MPFHIAIAVFGTLLLLAISPSDARATAPPHIVLIMTDDMGEQKNLASEEPELAARLDKQLGRWLEQTGAPMPARLK